MAALYTPHSRALTVLHTDLENHALGQREVFTGTAGSVIERSNATGFRFYAHQYYDGEGKKRERYLGGPVGSAEADATAQAIRERIRELKALVPSLRMLGREGYNLVDPRTHATLGSLHNHGVFAAGGMLIGSHAYGVLLNALGARAPDHVAADSRETVALEHVPEGLTLEALATASVQLVVPSSNEEFSALRIPGLKAHATGLPYLHYLLAESQTGMLMAREGCCGVRVPLPERFAIHKLLVSRLRVGRGAKSDRDIFQASVLCAVLADSHPGALESALAAVPRPARKYLKPALESARPHLETEHPRAWEELSGAVPAGKG